MVRMSTTSEPESDDVAKNSTTTRIASSDDTVTSAPGIGRPSSSTNKAVSLLASAVKATLVAERVRELLGDSKATLDAWAMEHKLDPALVTLMVGIGIPLSFLTLPLWWYVLQGV